MSCLFVEHLCVIDCAWLHPARGLLGESWIVDVELEGGLDDQGMVLDFGRVKPLVKALIDEHVDHRLIVPARAPALTLEDEGDEIRLRHRYDGRELYHRSPRQAVCLLDVEAVTPAAVEDHVRKLCAAVMPRNVSGVRISLRREAIAGASYRYVHGLRRHGGNCQRIAHGHRSRIEIFRDGRRCEASEHWLAQRWHDIYLGTRADLAAGGDGAGSGCYRFAYAAPQGEFELIIDRDRCELLDKESTVEQIAAYAAHLLKEREPGARFRVRAYEGVRKGAIADV
jgi:6-pyruvoyl-tetrahydropterin synthase